MASLDKEGLYYVKEDPQLGKIRGLDPWAVENGITSGVGDGRFAPDQTCTRAQSVTFLHRAAGEENGQSSGSFADVPQDSYYAGAVQWAVENGRFAPEARCTRSQIITFLYQTYQGK